MKITSNILGELAQAARRSTPGVYETEIVVPGVIQPTIVLSDVLHMLQPVNTAQLDHSFHFSEDRLVANAGTQTQNLVLLGPGVWDLNLHLNYSSNYPSIGGLGYVLSLTIGSSVSTLLNAQISPTAGGVVSHDRRLRVELDQVGTISSSLFTNAVGQNHQASLSLYGAKLL
jgi:hypothetical protein